MLTPGRCVGVPDEIDDGVSFDEKMKKMTGELKSQLGEERRLNAQIEKQLKKVGYDI